MSLHLIEYWLTVFLVGVMFALTIFAFIVGVTFFINLYKQIKLLREKENESVFNKLEW